MSSAQSITVTFDGTTDVPRLAGQSPVEWFDSRMDIYSVYHSGADLFTGTANLTGSDWSIRYLRIAGDDAQFNLVDLDSGADRRIELLTLGYNANVDLISTRVDYIFGWDGVLHDVALGSANTRAVNIYAQENIVTTGSGWVGMIETGGTDTITIGSGGAGTVRTGNGDATVTTTSEFVDFIRTGDGDDTVTIGSGGAATVRTRDGNDTVQTGTGWVETISTGNGDDTVNLGSAGAGQVRMSGGDDTIVVSELTPGDGVQIGGGSGTDTIDFSNFTAGVTFTLDSFGIWQNVTDPGGTGGTGWFSETSIDNIIGTSNRDILTGDDNANVLTGRGGNDRLLGGSGDDELNGGGGKDRLEGGNGNDKLIGGNGNDRMIGGNGKDNLIGGGGRDVLEGGRGNDFLRGNGGNDVFVFGANSGTDRVRDFADGSDILRLVGPDNDIGDLTITDQGANLRIAYDGGVILLLGEAGTVLTAADFDFV